MIYLHGGAFKSGSGSENLYGPDFLFTQDVLLVTVNYRLGPLGITPRILVTNKTLLELKF